MLDQWLVIVSGADMNEELRKVPDSSADFLGAADEVRTLPLRDLAPLYYPV